MDSPMPHPFPKELSQNYKHMSSKKLDRYTNNEILGKNNVKNIQAYVPRRAGCFLFLSEMRK